VLPVARARLAASMLCWRPDKTGSIRGMTTHPLVHFLAALAAAYLLAACTPTVKVEVPKEPITINLNVKIEHEIRVKVEKELEDLFEKKSGLF
jgi:hypothetical protein